jgi:ABC-2 type transport system ATP-binding protein
MSEMPKSGLVTDHLAKSYGHREILRDVCLYARPGECVGIVGTNGSGKSTLLSLLAGITKIRRGSYFCYGHDMRRDKTWFRRLIGYVPQENPLIYELSVRDNLMLWSSKKDADDIYAVRQLELEDLLNRRVSRLSGGERRRLSIACALSCDQPVLIMDEPSSALDLHQRAIIRQLIELYTTQNGIVILSTHDKEEMAACVRLYYLLKGEALEIKAQEAAGLLQRGIK